MSAEGLHRELLLSARKFRVERVEDRGDVAGRPVEVVVHPGAAVVLPLLDDGRVVMIRSRRLAVERVLLELPAGTLEPPEPPEVCAARELAEETGYRAGVVEPLARFYTSPGICTELMHAFVARELMAGAAQLEVGEHIEPVVLGYDQALDAIASGEVMDGKTIAALLLFDWLRRSR